MPKILSKERLFIFLVFAWIICVFVSLFWEWKSSENIINSFAQGEVRFIITQILDKQKDVFHPNSYLDGDKYPAQKIKLPGKFYFKSKENNARIEVLSVTEASKYLKDFDISQFNKEEVFSFIEKESEGDNYYLNVVFPVKIQEECLKCHIVDKHNVGDIWGVKIVSLPFWTYNNALKEQRIELAFSHFSFGLLGLALISFVWFKVQKYTKKLQEQEEQLRTLINSTPDIICFKDGEGRWLEANEADLELFCLKGVDYKGKTDIELAEYTHPIYKQAFLTCKETDEKAWQAKGISRGEEIIPRPDGTVKIYDVIKVPLFEPNGKRKGLVVLGRDITERKKAEAERQMLLEAIEQMAECIIITDADGKIKYVNSAFERIIGHNRKEVIGKNICSINKNESDEIFREIWHEVVSNNVWYGEITTTHEDGKVCVLEIAVSPVYNNEGVLWRYVFIVRDVTEQVRLKEEKAQLQYQLQQAQRLEAIGRLAGGVAHDFNNLLVPILGYCELLLNSGKLSKQYQSYIEQIVRAAQRARDIVHQLLAFSRKQSIEVEPVDLNKVVLDMQKLLRRTIRENVSIKLSLASSLPLIMVDVGQLEQVIMNLAINAQDAMPDGGVLTIKTELLELNDSYQAARNGVEPGVYVVLSVIDTGCGIDEEIIEHIFEPFFTTKEFGAGLGLASVYGIVKQHGGHIRVLSKPGKGTTFKIYFPVKNHFSADFSNTDQVDGKSKEENYADLKGSETILVVEDDEVIRDLIFNVLTNEGYKVMVAANGKEAVSLLEQHNEKLHLLLTDVIMPGMNGRELYTKMAEKYPDIKVIYMSGYPENIIVNHGILREKVVLIQKPFKIKDLLSKIREILDDGDS